MTSPDTANATTDNDAAAVDADTGHVLVAHQPAYLPWPGYFARLLDADRFLLLDHVQFSAGSWQQRNVILGSDGTRRLLTVPIRRPHHQPIRDVMIADDRWRARHWRIITDGYRHAPFWPQWEPHLATIYDRPWERLAALNEALLRLLLDGFGLSVKLVRSSELAPAGHRTDMLIDLCRLTGARVLRVGTGATSYLDGGCLARAEIGIEVATYSHPPYVQSRRGFLPGLSALDLLLHCGPAARSILAAGAAVSPWTSALASEVSHATR
ncbi:WbqC family protein [Frankia sp. Ag45/Mut15]|uniref:WbqC family protein n=1 Tax=Frankia umida TaxID=573489 RepID=A0ABT0K429_9ACTN|nr:WbqC family protein [Frankia umida]MCK9878274.1 WbqC family protein [Frankia umida]